MRDLALISKHEYKKGQRIYDHDIIELDRGCFCVKGYWENYLDKGKTASQDFVAWEIRILPNGDLFTAADEEGTQEIFLPLMDEVFTKAQERQCGNSFFAVFDVNYEGYQSSVDWETDYEISVTFVDILNMESLYQL